MTIGTTAPTRPRLARVAAALAAATLLSVPAAATASTVTQPENSIGVRLVDIPTDRIDDPRAQSAIVDHVMPGVRLERRIDIVSTVDSEVTVDLYGGNARIENGAFSPDPAEAGVAEWMSFSATPVTIAARGTERVSVAIDVPTGAPVGEYYGVIWVEPPASGGQVSVTNRVGLRVYLSVGTGAEPPVDFAIGQMTAGRDADGTPFVATTITNDGGRALDITGTLRLSEGPAGLTAGPFPFDGAVTLLPGESEPLRIALDPELPDGPWTARLDARASVLLRSAEAVVEFPSEAASEELPVESELVDAEGGDAEDDLARVQRQRRTLLPIAGLLILLALVLLFLLQWWQRRDGVGGALTSSSAQVARDDGD